MMARDDAVMVIRGESDPSGESSSPSSRRIRGLALIVLVVLGALWAVSVYQARLEDASLEEPLIQGGGLLEVGEEGLVARWVWASLDGQAGAAGALTYGENGEPEALAQLGTTLEHTRDKWGPPLVIIESHPDDLMEGYVCVEFDFGAKQIAGAVLVRTWPDLGRRLWEFRPDIAACDRPTVRLLDGRPGDAMRWRREVLFEEHAADIHTAAVDAGRLAGTEPLGFEAAVLIYQEGVHFDLRLRAVYPTGCRDLAIIDTADGGSPKVKGTLIRERAEQPVDCPWISGG